MKNTFKHFEKRVAALEKHLRPPRRPGLMLVQSLAPAEHAGLEPDQRIVKDRYFDAAGKMAMTRERITRDPSDMGKRFPDGSWDSTYLDRCKPDPQVPIRIFWTTAADHLIPPPGSASVRGDSKDMRNSKATAQQSESEVPKPDSELEPQNPESEASQGLTKPYDPLDLDDRIDDDEDQSLDLPDC